MAVAAERPPSLEPSLERARELAGNANVVPVRFRFIDDCETPVSAFLKLRAAFEGPAFLLESAEQGRMGRYSFLGFRPHASVTWRLGDEGDPYEIAERLVDSFDVAELEQLPPFAGGAVGFFGYDLVRTVEDLGEPNPDPVGLPDMALMLCELMVAFDHLKHEVTVVAYAFTGDDVESEYNRAAELIETVRAALREPIPRPAESSATTAPVEFASNMTQEEFEAKVSRIVEYVHAGDAFQVVPSQRFSAPTPVGAFSIYR